MSTQRVNITSPAGRVVMGSLYTPNTTDAEGKPLVIKNGPNAGQARTNYFFALAIPKAGEPHWAHTAWGNQIWNVGNLAFPQAAQSPAFAWKIEDGDSQTPNKRGRKPCDNEGWKGHWILKFSGGFAPKVYRQEGAGWVQVTEPEYIKPGYFVEVAFSVDGNGSQSQPGVYLNHSMVCFRAYGPEIVFGPDVNEAGFGSSPLPTGASLTPPASSIPLPAFAGAQPALAAPAPIPVTPNPSFLQVPPPAALPGPLAAPIAAYAGVSALPAIPGGSAIVAPAPSNLPPAPPAGPVMTAKAAGASREAFLAAGWTDAQLIAQGYMTV
jgi:hypothetical protein